MRPFAVTGEIAVVTGEIAVVTGEIACAPHITLLPRAYCLCIACVRELCSCFGARNSIELLSSSIELIISSIELLSSSVELFGARRRFFNVALSYFLSAGCGTVIQHAIQ